jgi:hypothetical protein
MPEGITTALDLLSAAQQGRLSDALYMQHASIELHQGFHDPGETSWSDIQLEVAIDQYLSDVYTQRRMEDEMFSAQAGPQCLRGWRREFVEAIGSVRVRSAVNFRAHMPRAHAESGRLNMASSRG